MSDNLRCYRAIRNALEEIYPYPPRGNLARHLNTLASLISGIVASHSSQLPKIANHQVDGIKRESRVKRYSRWVQNERIDYECYFLPFMEPLIGSLMDHPLVLIMDGSSVARGCLCLMGSLIYKKRALPLCWLVVSQKEGHLPEEVHLALLKNLKEIIPQQAQGRRPA